MTRELFEQLLASEESETLERKQGIDKDGIRRAIISFANDLYGHGGGWLIVGQGPDKSIVGLKIGDDEAQRTITDIARNNCSPAVPISVRPYEKTGRRLAFVEVRASPARPHFAGAAFVRMGSTTRLATDAEIMLLRAVQEDRKVAVLKRWVEEGKKTVVFWQMPAPGQDFRKSPGVEQAQLVCVNENWVELNIGGVKRTFPFSEFNLGYDLDQNLPQIRYHGAARP